MKTFEERQHSELVGKLENACHKGYVEVVDVLLCEKIDINEYGNHALQFAISQGHIDVVKLFIERGYVINNNNKGGDLLNIAIHNGYVEIAQYFVGLGVSLFNSYKYALSAASSDSLDMIDYIESLGIDVYQRGSSLKSVATRCSFNVLKKLFRLEDVLMDESNVIISCIATRKEEEIIMYVLHQGVNAKVMREASYRATEKVLMLYDIMVEKQELEDISRLIKNKKLKAKKI